MHTIEERRDGRGDMNARWAGVERPYTQADVERSAGASTSSTRWRPRRERPWKLLHSEDYVAALGALTGAQAADGQGGPDAIYLSGWQVAADANLSGTRIPTRACIREQRPALVKRLNSALLRADQIDPPKARTARTGSPRSSPTPRPASAARSTRSS